MIRNVKGLLSPRCGYDPRDRKSTRLNSSHLVISYAVFCLKKKIRNVNASRSPGCFLPVPLRSVVLLSIATIPSSVCTPSCPPVVFFILLASHPLLGSHDYI